MGRCRTGRATARYVLVRDSRIFVAGHVGLGGVGHPAAADSGRACVAAHRDARSAPTSHHGRNYCFRTKKQRVRFRRRHGRRHPGQLDAPGRVHLRQHDDPRHGGARRAPVRREEAAVPRQLLHLPARMPAADEARRAADRGRSSRPTSLRDRQDRRDQAVPGLPPRNTAATSSRRCRPTSTGRTTTSI